MSFLLNRFLQKFLALVAIVISLSFGMNSANAQTFTTLDNFSDGNFTLNPTWTVKAGAWQVSLGELQVTASSNDNRISTPFTRLCNAWEFDFKMDGSGFTGQKVEYYFFMTNASSDPLNASGYKVSYNLGSPYSISLQTVANGAVTNTIASFSFTPTSNDPTIRVTRDNNSWKLFVDGVDRGSGTDATYPSTSCAFQGGLVKLISSSILYNHGFDNIKYSEVGAGIYESYININNGSGDNPYYDLNASTINNIDFNGASLGSFNSGSTLILNGAENKIFRCTGFDVVNGKLYYRIYRNGNTPGDFNVLNLPNAINISGAGVGCQNQKWEETVANINLLSGLCDGNYTLEVYTTADYNATAGGGTLIANNGGDNYKATFTVNNSNLSGIFQSYIILNDGSSNIFYDLGATTDNLDFNSRDLGTFCVGKTLTLAGGENRTFKCSPNDILDNNFLFYRIYKNNATPGSFAGIKLPYKEGSNQPSPINSSCTDQKWEKNDNTTNILDGLSLGTYTLEVYTQADYTTNGICPGTHFSNNGGSNYKATFTISQPTEPAKVNCWDSYEFNTTSCSWVNVGVQPTEPAKVNCWDSYEFNTTSCSWVNVGVQPTEPAKVNCWDSYEFNTTSCSWVNVGVQPTEPAKVNCWDSYEFNTTSCSWVNVGVQPTEPAKVNCWDSYEFNTTSCSWVNVGVQPTEPAKVNCWDSYEFNTTSCSWVNVGVEPTEPAKVNCWDSYEFNTTSCSWVNVGVQPTEPAKVNCWDSYEFNTTSCSWVNVGVQPTEPAKVNCWDSYEFNTTSCSWVNVGVQPTEPAKVNCWDSYEFNTTSCSWVNVGVQPTEPAKVNCWDSYEFNTTSCSWVNVGVQPTEPAKVNCWDSYEFNTTSCSWVNVGVQPTEPAKVNCWDSYEFNTTSCSWVNVGVQPTEPAKVNCWDSYEFNTTSCSWVNVGVQPTEPAKVNCWDSYEFNTTSCSWVNVGVQPTEPAKVNCWDSYEFNTTSCSWVNVGVQPTEPAKVNCWDSYEFNTTSCSWVNVGVQPTEPAKVNCWDSYEFNTTSCSWVNVGVQPTEPAKVNCWDSYEFNTTSCSWVNVGVQPTEPAKVNCWDSYEFNTTSCSWVNVGVPKDPLVTNANGCGTYVWSVNGVLYSEAGTYSVNLNCQDYTLNLTLSTPLIWYKDADNDAYTDGTTQTSCDRPAGYKLASELVVTDAVDCNDNNAAINPDAAEICNGIDDNCNGFIDEGTNTRVDITAVTVQPASQQYSDRVTFTATVTGQGCFTNNIPGSIVFRIGNQVMGTAPVINGVATLSNVALLEPLPKGRLPVEQLLPGVRTVTAAYFDGTIDNISFDPSSTSITILKEDAVTEYTGPQFASTGSGSSANVRLSASVRDITAADPIADPNAGIITNAKARFIIRTLDPSTLNIVATTNTRWLNVNLTGADTRLGAIVLDTLFNIGDNTSLQYEIGVEVDSFYTSSINSIGTLIVSKTSRDFVTFGAHLLMRPNTSAGLYASNTDSRVNFTGQVRTIKSGSRPRGGINMIWRSGTRVYRARGLFNGSAGTLTVRTGANGNPEAILVTNVRITDSRSGADVPNTSGSVITMRLQDNGEPGSRDSAAIEIMNGAGQLLFSSYRLGNLTEERVLSGGNVQIHGTAPSARQINEALITGTQVFDLKVFSNPTTHSFGLQVSSADHLGRMTLRVMDVNGRMVEQFDNLKAGQNLTIGGAYDQGIYFAELIQGDQRKVVRLMKLK